MTLLKFHDELLIRKYAEDRLLARPTAGWLIGAEYSRPEKLVGQEIGMPDIGKVSEQRRC